MADITTEPAALPAPAKVRGRPFLAGNSGRPKGSKNKSLQLFEAINDHDPEALRTIVGKVTDAAVKGERWAIQVLMDKLYVTPKDRAVEFDLPPIRTPEDIPVALDSVLQAAANGTLSPGEAASLCGTIVDCNQKIMNDVRVYLATVRKLAEAGDKQGLAQIQAPY